nr:forkhead box protein D3 [Pogona vitticeps]
MSGQTVLTAEDVDIDVSEDMFDNGSFLRRRKRFKRHQQEQLREQTALMMHSFGAYSLAAAAAALGHQPLALARSTAAIAPILSVPTNIISGQFLQPATSATPVQAKWPAQ